MPKWKKKEKKLNSRAAAWMSVNEAWSEILCAEAKPWIKSFIWAFQQSSLPLSGSSKSHQGRTEWVLNKITSDAFSFISCCSHQHVASVCSWEELIFPVNLCNLWVISLLNGPIALLPVYHSLVSLGGKKKNSHGMAASVKEPVCHCAMFSVQR